MNSTKKQLRKKLTKDILNEFSLRRKSRYLKANDVM